MPPLDSPASRDREAGKGKRERNRGESKEMSLLCCLGSYVLGLRSTEAGPDGSPELDREIGGTIPLRATGVISRSRKLLVSHHFAVSAIYEWKPMGRGRLQSMAPYLRLLETSWLLTLAGSTSSEPQAVAAAAE